MAAGGAWGVAAGVAGRGGGAVDCVVGVVVEGAVVLGIDLELVLPDGCEGVITLGVVCVLLALFMADVVVGGGGGKVVTFLLFWVPENLGSGNKGVCRREPDCRAGVAGFVILAVGNGGRKWWPR